MSEKIPSNQEGEKVPAGGDQNTELIEQFEKDLAFQAVFVDVMREIAPGADVEHVKDSYLTNFDQYFVPVESDEAAVEMFHEIEQMIKDKGYEVDDLKIKLKTIFWSIYVSTPTIGGKKYFSISTHPYKVTKSGGHEPV